MKSWYTAQKKNPKIWGINHQLISVDDDSAKIYCINYAMPEGLWEEKKNQRMLWKLGFKGLFVGLNLYIHIALQSSEGCIVWEERGGERTGKYYQNKYFMSFLSSL